MSLKKRTGQSSSSPKRAQKKPTSSASPPRGASLMVHHSALSAEILATAPLLVYVSEVFSESADELSSRIIWANHKAETWFGHSLASLRKMKDSAFTGILHPDALAPVLVTYSEVANNTGLMETAAFRARHASGKYRWLHGSFYALPSSKKKTTQIVTIATDYSDYSNSESVLKELLKHNKDVSTEDLKLRNLSKREQEIIRLITQGMTSHEIAELLSLSKMTIQTHRQNILRKLNLKRPADLIRFALEHDLT
jgi:DNA-binding CsgD family transcriptional regulator